jgi:ketosteroid isomerase-like protein
MSEENVEIVRSCADALAQGDLDAGAQLLDPAFEFDVTRTDMNPRVYHGLDGVLELMSEWTSAYDDYEFEVANLVEAADDRVVGILRERGKMKGSGAWVEHVRGVVWTIRAGKVLRYDEYPTERDALEAAGVSE